MVHARLYPWRRPRGWWLRNPRYFVFIVREIGGVFAAVYGLVLLILVYQFRVGPVAHAAFLSVLTSPLALGLTAIVFAFVLVHAITWFVSIAKSQLMRFSEKPMRWQRAFVINVGLWIVISVAVLVLIFGGF